MNNESDEMFAERLQQRLPNSVSGDVKSRLLYQCGVSATESRFKKQRRRQKLSSLAIAGLALLLGGIAGRFLDESSFSSENQIATNQEQSRRGASDEVEAANGVWANLIHLESMASTNVLGVTTDLDQLDAKLARQAYRPPAGDEPEFETPIRKPLSVGNSGLEINRLNLP